MAEMAITRRGFLAASAAGAALAASGATLTGCASTPAVDQAYADEVVNTQCTACAKQCGYAAYVVDGSIDKVVGHATNPHAAGTLCARGFGSATVAASEDRLTEPLRRKDDGTYEPVEWDVALEEIARGLNDIKGQKGPEALAVITDGTSTADFYLTRFINALGSGNSYVDAATTSLSVASGLAQVTGYTACEVDYAQAKMVVILDASVVEMPDPGTVAGLEKAKENGAAIVMVDSRMPASASLATEWLPVRAGTELALVLALGHVLVERNKVAKEAAAAMEGYQEWAASLASYTPSWAAEITGLSADRIETLALELAAAAPAASLDLSWLALFGGGYGNAGELVRATALVNAMLGSWNVPGGVYAETAAVDLTGTKLAPLAVTAVDVTAADYPLAAGGSAPQALRLAHDGVLEGLILADANVVAEYPDPAYIKEAIEACTLSVAITPEMTETAACCSFVLPEKVWSESAQLPTVSGAVHPTLVVSSQVIEPQVEQARSIPEIVESLAAATGTESSFPFTLAEATEAYCEACGCTAAGAAAVGSSALTAKTAAWPTASGKIQCASDAAAQAGLTALPGWVAPTVSPDALGFEFYRLTTGNGATQTTAKTVNAAPLAAIAKQYALNRLWMSAETAADLGVAEGDEVVIENEYASAPVAVHVTELIEPTALYLAAPFGVENKEQTQADGVGVRQARFVPFALETAYGAPLLQETMVTVGKAGA